LGTLKVSAKVDVSGALASGAAGKALADWEQRTSQALADEAVKELGSFPMDKTGRATGAFREHLHPTRENRSEVTVVGPTVKGVVWSPWLEGTSKRNQSTGFPGYHVFRKTRLELGKRAEEIGQRELDAVMREIGGE
jgi:hypothetical protein